MESKNPESKKSEKVLVDKFERYEKYEKTKKPKGGPEDDTNMIIESSEKIEIVQSFDELNLREELLRGVYAYGFDKPSAV
jgi:superfamily II DNA/RNA helicase